MSVGLEPLPKRQPENTIHNILRFKSFHIPPTEPMTHTPTHTFPSLPHMGLYTDLYELTMAQGYFLSGRSTQSATFDYFFRSLPYKGGYVIFAGLGDLLHALSLLRFDEGSLDYLAQQGFHQSFLNYLRTFSFKGNIHAVREGEVVFPLEPLVRIEGSIIETQLIETLLLNILNFESLVATKAARIRNAIGPKCAFFEFGLRRAQGTGSLQATRAAIIGGANGTSNVLAGCLSGFTIGGTMAHSWVQHFEQEIEAFRTYATHYPDSCVLLVDTYNTINSGIPNAITIAHELKQKGHTLKAIRLDSGDLAYLSKKARAQLDEAGLQNVQIYATNQLDEHLIKSLIDQGAPIDLFGVGTSLVTGNPDAALDGVYKLCMSRNAPCLKVSDNFTKVNFPGRKTLTRFTRDDGMFYGDAITLVDEPTPETIHHPFFPEQHSKVLGKPHKALLETVMSHGQITSDIALAQPSTHAAWAIDRLSKLPEEHKRFANPHTFKVGASKSLLQLRSDLYAALQYQE